MKKEYFPKMPLIVSNRLIEQIEMVANDIEVEEFPSSMREGMYDKALTQIKAWQNGEIDHDQFLYETFLKAKRNEVGMALRLIKHDRDTLQNERNKETISKIKEKMREVDNDFSPTEDL